MARGDLPVTGYPTQQGGGAPTAVPSAILIPKVAAVPQMHGGNVVTPGGVSIPKEEIPAYFQSVREGVAALSPEEQAIVKAERAQVGYDATQVPTAKAVAAMIEAAPDRDLPNTEGYTAMVYDPDSGTHIEVGVPKSVGEALAKGNWTTDDQGNMVAAYPTFSGADDRSALSKLASHTGQVGAEVAKQAELDRLKQRDSEVDNGGALSNAYQILSRMFGEYAPNPTTLINRASTEAMSQAGATPGKAAVSDVLAEYERMGYDVEGAKRALGINALTGLGNVNPTDLSLQVAIPEAGAVKALALAPWAARTAQAAARVKAAGAATAMAPYAAVAYDNPAEAALVVGLTPIGYGALRGKASELAAKFGGEAQQYDDALARTVKVAQNNVKMNARDIMANLKEMLPNVPVRDLATTAKQVFDIAKKARAADTQTKRGFINAGGKGGFGSVASVFDDANEGLNNIAPVLAKADMPDEVKVDALFKSRELLSLLEGRGAIDTGLFAKYLDPVISQATGGNAKAHEALSRYLTYKSIWNKGVEAAAKNTDTPLANMDEAIALMDQSVSLPSSEASSFRDIWDKMQQAADEYAAANPRDPNLASVESKYTQAYREAAQQVGMPELSSTYMPTYLRPTQQMDHVVDYDAVLRGEPGMPNALQTPQGTLRTEKPAQVIFNADGTVSGAYKYVPQFEAAAQSFSRAVDRKIADHVRDLTKIGLDYDLPFVQKLSAAQQSFLNKGELDDLVAKSVADVNAKKDAELKQLQQVASDVDNFKRIISGLKQVPASEGFVPAVSILKNAAERRAQNLAERNAKRLAEGKPAQGQSKIDQRLARFLKAIPDTEVKGVQVAPNVQVDEFNRNLRELLDDDLVAEAGKLKNTTPDQLFDRKYKLTNASQLHAAIAEAASLLVKTDADRLLNRFRRKYGDTLKIARKNEQLARVLRGKSDTLTQAQKRSILSERKQLTKTVDRLQGKWAKAVQPETKARIEQQIMRVRAQLDALPAVFHAGSDAEHNKLVTQIKAIQAKLEKSPKSKYADQWRRKIDDLTQRKAALPQVTNKTDYAAGVRAQTEILADQIKQAMLEEAQTTAERETAQWFAQQLDKVKTGTKDAYQLARAGNEAVLLHKDIAGIISSLNRPEKTLAINKLSSALTRNFGQQIFSLTPGSSLVPLMMQMTSLGWKYGPVVVAKAIANFAKQVGEGSVRSVLRNNRTALDQLLEEGAYSASGIRSSSLLPFQQAHKDAGPWLPVMPLLERAKTQEGIDKVLDRAQATVNALGNLTLLGPLAKKFNDKVYANMNLASIRALKSTETRRILQAMPDMDPQVAEKLGGMAAQYRVLSMQNPNVTGTLVRDAAWARQLDKFAKTWLVFFGPAMKDFMTTMAGTHPGRQAANIAGFTAASAMGASALLASYDEEEMKAYKSLSAEERGRGPIFFFKTSDEPDAPLLKMQLRGNNIMSFLYSIPAAIAELPYMQEDNPDYSAGDMIKKSMAYNVPILSYISSLSTTDGKIDPAKLGPAFQLTYSIVKGGGNLIEGTPPTPSKGEIKNNNALVLRLAASMGLTPNEFKSLATNVSGTGVRALTAIDRGDVTAPFATLVKQVNPNATPYLDMWEKSQEFDQKERARARRTLYETGDLEKQDLAEELYGEQLQGSSSGRDSRSGRPERTRRERRTSR